MDNPIEPGISRINIEVRMRRYINYGKILRKQKEAVENAINVAQQASFGYEYDVNFSGIQTALVDVLKRINRLEEMYHSKFNELQNDLDRIRYR